MYISLVHYFVNSSILHIKRPSLYLLVYSSYIFILRVKSVVRSINDITKHFQKTAELNIKS